MWTKLAPCLTLIAVACLAVLTEAQGGCGVNPSHPSKQPVVPASTVPGYTLVQAQVVIRHGDRMIAGKGTCWANDTATFDCDMHHAETPLQGDLLLAKEPPRLYRKVYVPGKESYKGNCATGQLTSKGAAQERLHGQQLRDAYVTTHELLGPTLDANLSAKIYLRSDDEPRTCLSAESLMLGMFPPTGDGADLVVDLHTVDHDHDMMECNPVNCPGISKIMAKGRASTQYKMHLTSITDPLYEELSMALGEDISPELLPDCLNVHLCHGKTVPAAFSPQLQQRVIDDDFWRYNYLSNYPNRTENAKHCIGPLIDSIYNAMVAAAVGNEDAKLFHLWSGHDVTVMPILAGLGQLKKWAPYASLIAFELYVVTTSPDSLSVRTVYNGDVLTLEGCGGQQMCPYLSFISLLEAMLPTAAICPGYFEQFPLAREKLLARGGMSGPPQIRDFQKEVPEKSRHARRDGWN